MKATFKNYSINATFKGDKSWSASKTENRNNYIVTVTNTENGMKTSFDFWQSIAQPKMKDENDVLNALYCFLDDGIAGKMSFSEFASEFGYDEDSRKAEKIWRTCKRATAKFERIAGNDDIYDLINALQEEYNF